jgi:signal transduction histidine kinase
MSFAVADNGIGIAPEFMPRLFNSFEQCDAGLTREHAGTGLGLALVDRMTRMHGGSVAVESRLGEGTRFTVTLDYPRKEFVLEARRGVVRGPGR